MKTMSYKALPWLILLGFMLAHQAGAVSYRIPNPIAAENFIDLVKILAQWIFTIAIPVAVIVIIWAGIQMVSASGNPGKFQKGKDALWYAVIGLAVVFIGRGFISLIRSILELRNP